MKYISCDNIHFFYTKSSNKDRGYFLDVRLTLVGYLLMMGG